MSNIVVSNDAPKSDGITQVIVDRVRRLYTQDLQAEVRDIAKSRLLDWCGTAIAACEEPLVQILIASAIEDGVGSRASVVNAAGRFSTRQAVLINGAMGHVLDYDDTHPSAHCHVTAAVLPAALTAAEVEGASGEDLLRAFVAGYEAAVMVGLFTGTRLYDQGFHATGVVGAFGAAAASTALMQLDSAQTAQALGIAASQAAGLKAQLGTMCKALHAGKANENGLYAAQLARRGFTSRANILECAQGFADAHHGQCLYEVAIAPPAQAAHIVDGIAKFHAACHGVHGTIDAIHELLQNHALSAANIEKITLRVHPKLGTVCHIDMPRTGLESKFSLRFCAALAVSGCDTAALETYSDSMVERPDIRELAGRVSVVLTPDTPRGVTEVDVLTRDGHHHSAQYRMGEAKEDIRSLQARVERKFIALAAPRMGVARAEALADLIRRIDTMPDVRNLMEGLRVASDIA